MRKYIKHIVCKNENRSAVSGSIVSEKEPEATVGKEKNCKKKEGGLSNYYKTSLFFPIWTY
jgi:hypothetical protein